MLVNRSDVNVVLITKIQTDLTTMFLFSCCTQIDSNEGYELRAKHSKQQQYSVISNIDHQSIDYQTQVLKVKKSQYPELVMKYRNSREMWEDQEFPHNGKSLGDIQGVKVAEWKRLSQIMHNPVLFDGHIQPQDAIQGSLGDCYFLSAVSALAEREERITSIFGDQEGLKNGIYRVTLRVNGVIAQILVDDFVPVNNRGEPLFCQPNKNEIWVPILEKAWAKANGSYANIVAGCPSEIFRAATYAPAETIETGQSKEDIQKLWKYILKNAKLNRPCCCGTDDGNNIDWQRLHLVPGHAYTLIDAAELNTRDGSNVRMLKLRNPWGNTEWQGQGCETDHKFWSSVVADTQAKNIFLKDQSINNDGIFYIQFNDYCKYFAQTHFCYMQEQGNYIYQNFMPSPKRGTHWSMVVFQEGQYCLQLHQDSIRDDNQDQSRLARLTLILANNKEPSGFELINGNLSQFRQDCSMRVYLKPGNYTIFTKLDANQSQEVSLEASVSVYSLFYVILSQASEVLAKPMLKQCLLDHARGSKRRRYQNDTLWISWKLMYKEGGYAYICFGAEKNARHKWSVSFNESDFKGAHFKLKKPYKRRGEGQTFEVQPGEEKIVLARVMNDNPTNLKFPPKMSYKIQPIT